MENSRIRELVFITGNAAKAKYLSSYFHFPVNHVKLDLSEIQSLDLRSIVEDKAKRAYEIVKKPVIVEDVSLTFLVLKNLPGPLIKWFLESIGNSGMCRLLGEQDDRSAIAEVQFAFCDDQGVKIFPGSVQGEIATTPRGTTDFGWDPIFVPLGHTKTWAEMSLDEKHETSMRKIALVGLKKFLEGYQIGGRKI